MADPIYKQSDLLRTVFYLLCAALFLISGAAARAETNPAYTVEGVEVDVTAENAVKAREKAMEEAQVKGYQMLAERFLSPDEMKSFKMPDPITVSTLVQDFEVTAEQLSTTRYKGVYTIRFRPNAMKMQMASKGISYSDVQRKPVMVLPFYQHGGTTFLWSDQNPWMAAWRGLPADKNTLQQSIVPLGDAADMAQVREDLALEYDPVEVQELANRYGADDIAVTVASLDYVGKQSQITVNIYKNGFEGPVFVQKTVIPQNAGEEEQAFFTRAAQQVKGLLRQDWKANAAYNPNIPPPAIAQPPVPQPGQYTDPGSMYQQQRAAIPPSAQTAPVPYTRPALGTPSVYPARVRFGNPQDWVRMKNTMDRIYGMQSVMIKSLRPREAVIDLRFAGSVSALQLALQNAGIQMRASSDGLLDIYSTPTQSIYGQ